tara:strand:- start:206 stop:523 length:318 start_codon:yes stop_codon:yes gene_type:complete
MNNTVYRLSKLVSKLAETRYLQGGTQRPLKDWSLDYAEGLLEASRLLEDFAKASDKMEQLEDMEELFRKHVIQLRAEQTDQGKRKGQLEQKRCDLKFKTIGYFGR